MMDFIGELFEAIGMGAMVLADLVIDIQHAGAPARYVVLDTDNKRVAGFFVEHGQWLRVQRAHRLIVEDVDHVLIRPLCEVAKGWWVQ